MGVPRVGKLVLSKKDFNYDDEVTISVGIELEINKDRWLGLKTKQRFLVAER